MLNTNQFKEKISKHEIIIGTHVAFESICITELLGNVGYDFIWIDAEHSALDKKDIQHHLIACKASSSLGIVRVPWNDPVMVKALLDMGSDGIIFPMIRTLEEAKLAVSSCIYPPNGIRGVGLRRANCYGLGDKEQYFNNATSSILKILQIEHIDILDDLEEILKIENIDAMVIGPNDFASSMGKINKSNDSDVQSIFDEISKLCIKYNKPFGVSGAYSPTFVEKWIARGVSFISLGFDFNFIAKAASETLLGTRIIFNKLN